MFDVAILEILLIWASFPLSLKVTAGGGKKLTLMFSFTKNYMLIQILKITLVK